MLWCASGLASSGASPGMRARSAETIFSGAAGLGRLRSRRLLGGQGAPKRRLRGLVIDDDLVAVPFDAQLLPEGCEIRLVGRSSHFLVKLTEDRGAGRIVALPDHFVDRPHLRPIPACVENPPEGGLERGFVLRALPNPEIRFHPEIGAAPIGASPGLRAVEPPVPGTRQSPGHPL